MTVIRRSVDESGWPIGRVMPSGEYVAATDYDEVCQQLREAAGENERLRSQLAGAVEALRAARQCITDHNPQDDAGFYDDAVQVVLDQIDAALGEQQTHG
jgi:hypothetical protein